MLLRYNKILLVVFVLVALSAMVYAFAASNTNPVMNNTGSGTDAVQGYTITALAYNLYAVNPMMVGTITFTLTPISGNTNDNATVVKIRTAAADTTMALWTCVPVATAVTCTPAGGAGTISSASVTTLDVVATN